MQKTKTITDTAQQHSMYQTARRLLREALATRLRLYCMSIICVIGVAVFTGALAYSTRLIVNDVFVADDTSAAYKVAALVVGISLFKSFFQYCNGVIGILFERSISAQFQKSVFAKLLHGKITALNGSYAADTMAQIKVYGIAAGRSVLFLSNNLLAEALTVIALFAVMIAQDPWMTLFSSVMFPLIFGLVGLLSRKIRAVANSETTLSGAYFAIGAEAFSGIKTVKSYALEKKSIEKFDGAVDALEDRMFSIARVTQATVPIMELLGGIVIGAFVVYAAWQTITNGKTPGEFTAFITAFLLAYAPAERLSHIWVELQKNLVQVAHMFDVLDAPNGTSKTAVHPISGTDNSVVFDNVSFSYTDAKALSDVNLNIASGERLAIVGRSGAGKSTAIDLILRFYNPTKGRILIGGQDLAEASETSIRDNIALISQDVFLFEGTIRENIRDGHPIASDQDIAQAAEQAALRPFLDQLPNGLDTVIGPNGGNLSGGQKQRIGIARALVKPAKVYVFDEATSALDPENERLIMETLVKTLEGKTVIFVTHRPSTLEYVHRVAMLDQGKLVACGTLAELDAENTTFKELFN